ncbi:hypothetical protein F511_26093 [Dorcoceras hygrometricum]|uniref:Uncharacterized protein n=1 Tax=Dorcoceras hygrometricum TaxID=472368 RepID=A0A2Z7CJC0_9LAMI|nr:hypothetical protein F511_26093 [Dorcoceras hygrometricum]
MPKELRDQLTSCQTYRMKDSGQKTDLTLVNEIFLSGVSRCELLLEEVSDVRFGDFRCDQDLRSVSGIFCESGLRCYIVLISKSNVVLSISNLISPIFIPDNPSIGTVHPNPISVDCRRFSLPFGARLVALSLSSLGISIDMETGIAGFEEREVVAVFVGLRDCGPVVLLFFNSFGFELVVASVEFAVKLLGQ